MPRTYQTTPNESCREWITLHTAKDRFHAPLKEAGVTIGILLAHAPRDKNDDPTGHAVEVNGFPSKHKTKINGLRDRVEGKPDVTIEIDADAVDEWSDETLLAVMDAALSEVGLVIDEGGAIVRDDVNRPKLRKRKADWLIRGFIAVAERHKGADPAVEQIAKLGGEAVRLGWLAGF